MKKAVLLGLLTQVSVDKLNLDPCLPYGKKKSEHQMVNLKDVL